MYIISINEIVTGEYAVIRQLLEIGKFNIFSHKKGRILNPARVFGTNAG